MVYAGNSMTKIIQLEPEFERTGEPRVRYIDPRDTHLHKYASAGALDYIKNVQPLPGHRIVLVLAMSAYEYYGPNRNGDGFNELEYSIPGINGGLPLLDRSETLPEHYKSFETTAHNFLHHVNKDPAKAVGKVLKAFYNWEMHRVELLLAVDECKAPRVCQRIMDGEYPGVSMGCRIKYDICTICGNRAPTRAQYCEHVNGKNPQYGMNTILPDGRQCAVLNPSPNLFDISWVFRPADRVGYMMKKVARDAYTMRSADLGSIVEEASRKTATLHKLSLMDKFVEGEVDTLDHDTSSCGCDKEELQATEQIHNRLMPGLCRDFAPVSERAIALGAQHGMPSFVSSLNAVGVHPTVHEFYRVICRRSGQPPQPSIMRLLPLLQSVLLELFTDVPSVLDAFEGAVTPHASHVKLSLVREVLPLVEKRALYKEHLLRKYVPEEHAYLAPLLGQSEETFYQPTHQPLHVRDPATGRGYTTTRAISEETDWENTKKDWLDAGLLAAGTGAGYKALSMLGKSKGGTLLGAAANLAKVPAAALGAHASYSALNSSVPTVQTAEGVLVPRNTPMVEKSGSVGDTLRSLKHLATDSYAGPLVGGGLGAMMLGSDRFAQGAPPQLKQTARENPLITTLVGAAGIGSLRGLLKNRAASLKAAHVQNGNDAVTTVPVDVGSLLEKLSTEWMPIFRSLRDCG